MRLVRAILFIALAAALSGQVAAQAGDSGEAGFDGPGGPEADARADDGADSGDAAAPAEPREPGQEGDPAATPPPLPGPDGSGPGNSAEILGNGEIEKLHRDPWKGNPKELAPGDHGDFVRAHETALVLLTGKNCHLCRRMNREFVRAEWLARSLGMDVAFAKVETESDDGTQLLKRLNVGALPVLFLNTNRGKERVFIEEWWSAEPLVADVQLKLKQLEVIAPVRTLEDPGDVATWLFDRANDQGVFQTTAVLFAPHPGWHSEPLALANDVCMEVFQEAARTLAHDDKTAFRNRPRFAQVEAQSVIEAFGLPMDRPSIVLYKDYDDGKAIFNGSCDGERGAVQEFITAEATPRVVIANHGNLKDHLTRGTNIIHVFVPGQTLDDGRTTRPVVDAMQRVMKRMEKEQLVDRGEFMAFVSNGHQYHGWLKDYGLQRRILPAVGVDILDRRRRYALPQLSTATNATEPSVTDEASQQVDPATAPKPDPETGLLPTPPVDPAAEVSLDEDELVRGIADVLERRVKAAVVYGAKPQSKGKKAAKGAKKAAKGAKKAAKGAKKAAKGAEAAAAASGSAD